MLYQAEVAPSPESPEEFEVKLQKILKVMAELVAVRYISENESQFVETSVEGRENLVRYPQMPAVINQLDTTVFARDSRSLSILTPGTTPFKPRPPDPSPDFFGSRESPWSRASVTHQPAISTSPQPAFCPNRLGSPQPFARHPAAAVYGSRSPPISGGLVSTRSPSGNLYEGRGLAGPEFSLYEHRGSCSSFFDAKTPSLPAQPCLLSPFASSGQPQTRGTVPGPQNMIKPSVSLASLQSSRSKRQDLSSVFGPQAKAVVRTLSGHRSSVTEIRLAPIFRTNVIGSPGLKPPPVEILREVARFVDRPTGPDDFEAQNRDHNSALRYNRSTEASMRCHPYPTTPSEFLTSVRSVKENTFNHNSARPRPFNPSGSVHKTYDFSESYRRKDVFRAGTNRVVPGRTGAVGGQLMNFFKFS